MNDYITAGGLAHDVLFARWLQALIELARAGSEERTILESPSNHIVARADIVPSRRTALVLGDTP